MCEYKGGRVKDHKAQGAGGGRWRVWVCVCACVSRGYLAGLRVLFKRERVFSIVGQLNTRSEIQGEGWNMIEGELVKYNTGPLVVPHSHYLLWPHTHPCSPFLASQYTHLHIVGTLGWFAFIHFFSSSLHFDLLTQKETWSFYSNPDKSAMSVKKRPHVDL